MTESNQMAASAALVALPWGCMLRIPLHSVLYCTVTVFHPVRVPLCEELCVLALKPEWGCGVADAIWVAHSAVQPVRGMCGVRAALVTG